MRDYSKVPKERKRVWLCVAAIGVSCGFRSKSGGRLRRRIAPEVNAISTIVFVFSRIAVVFSYRLQTRAEGTEVAAAAATETADLSRLLG